MANLSIDNIRATLLLLLVLLATTFIWCNATSRPNSTEATPLMVPVEPMSEYFQMGTGIKADQYVCAGCICCPPTSSGVGIDRNECVNTKCCGVIKCAEPSSLDKPNQTCKYQPIKCNCDSCGPE